MLRIAVTGHVHVSAAVAQWVLKALQDRLRREDVRRIHGVTCLAEGTDQIFARAVLALNGTFEIVLPARDYARQVVRGTNRAEFEELVRLATTVRTMDFDESGREAYLAASEEMLRHCDLLLAIWDGRPSRQTGDTADVVARARERGLPIEILWPERDAGAESTGSTSHAS